MAAAQLQRLDASTSNPSYAAIAEGSRRRQVLHQQ
jgi:hypothetical protein